MLKKTSFTRRSFGKVRNFFQATIFKPAHEKNPAVNQYFKNTILKKLELKMKGSEQKVDLEDDNVYFICLFCWLRWRRWTIIFMKKKRRRSKKF